MEKNKKSLELSKGNMPVVDFTSVYLGNFINPLRDGIGNDNLLHRSLLTMRTKDITMQIDLKLDI